MRTTAYEGKRIAHSLWSGKLHQIAVLMLEKRRIVSEARRARKADGSTKVKKHTYSDTTQYPVEPPIYRVGAPIGYTKQTWHRSTAMQRSRNILVHDFSFQRVEKGMERVANEEKSVRLQFERY